ncbi:hypothetical protein BCR33DRAFT_715486 [Rhizoclosmatium globosum]|uniref:PH domain-containing protein n=1 Tax=Rhizoclosmatium globosum TaxID=329046 RepID=A0A1Y2CJA6_9FUNG|nr:hypothetical protein BCR33DRAFT_715486 [Rhizoclosmatium globosum]|eukprot:ORY46385.1 hypothetical protein BCR33DRAFT_715486 [Rhizoclosmatium globosum]
MATKVDSLLMALRSSFEEFMDHEGQLTHSLASDPEITPEVKQLLEAYKQKHTAKVADLLNKTDATSGQLYIIPEARYEDTAKLQSLPWAPRFIVMCQGSLFQFADPKPTNEAIDYFDLSEKTFVLPKLQRINVPLAFEIVSTLPTGETKSWLLRANNLATKNMWVELINKAIAEVSFELQAAPKLKKINSSTEFALETKETSVYSFETLKSNANLSPLEPTDPAPPVPKIPWERFHGIEQPFSAPVLSEESTLDYASPAEMEIQLATKLNDSKRVRGKKSTLMRRNSDSYSEHRRSSSLMDEDEHWKSIGVPPRESQMQFAMDEAMARALRQAVIVEAEKVDHESVLSGGVEYTGRSMSELPRRPSTAQSTTFSRLKGWFGSSKQFK